MLSAINAGLCLRLDTTYVLKRSFTYIRDGVLAVTFLAVVRAVLDSEVDDELHRANRTLDTRRAVQLGVLAVCAKAWSWCR